MILVGFCFLLQYVYWINYGRPTVQRVVREDSKEILTSQDTYWINDPLQLFYVRNNELRTISLNGKNDRSVFKLEEPILEYSFSPDNKYLLTITAPALYLVDIKGLTIRKIEEIFPPGQKVSPEFRGSISGCQWSPDSSRFVYEVSRWSKFTTQFNTYIYDVTNLQKNIIKSPTRKLSSLFWDKNGENLFYFNYEERDTLLYDYPYDVKVFRVPLTNYVPELVTEVPYDKRDLPLERLKERGIDLIPGTTAVFRDKAPDILVSEKGLRVGIDSDDFFYFVPNQWFRRRYFRIPRRSDPISQRYAYKGGDLLIEQIRWLPGDKYVLLRHRDWGFLIFEPGTGRLGLLGLKDGSNFGWAFYKGTDAI
jgi:hypothetical protein